MQETTMNNITEQTTVLESLQALLMDEQQVLRESDYNRLNDITELKKVLLGKLEYLSGAEPVNGTLLDENAETQLTSDLKTKRTLLLQQCAELNIRNGIEINKNFAFVQGVLNNMVGRQDSAVAYTRDGYQFDGSAGRLNATV